jgi:hypothetical protein
MCNANKLSLGINIVIIIFPNPMAKQYNAKVCHRSRAEIAGSNPADSMDVFCCECCVLSGGGLCDRPITHPEDSNRLWCV